MCVLFLNNGQIKTNSSSSSSSSCNGNFHLGIDTVYIINHWYLNDNSFPLRSRRKGYSPFCLAPLFLRTITFILIIMSSFILIMFGERIEAHGFANTITIWRAR